MTPERALEIFARSLIREIMGSPEPLTDQPGVPGPWPVEVQGQGPVPRFDFDPASEDPMGAAREFMESGALPPEIVPDNPKAEKAKRYKQRLFPEERTAMYPESPE